MRKLPKRISANKNPEYTIKERDRNLYHLVLKLKSVINDAIEGPQAFTKQIKQLCLTPYNYKRMTTPLRDGDTDSEIYDGKPYKGWIVEVIHDPTLVSEKQVEVETKKRKPGPKPKKATPAKSE